MQVMVVCLISVADTRSLCSIIFVLEGPVEIAANFWLDFADFYLRAYYRISNRYAKHHPLVFTAFRLTVGSI